MMKSLNDYIGAIDEISLIKAGVAIFAVDILASCSGGMV